MCVLCVSDRTLTEYESSFRSPLCRIPEEGGATDGDTPQVRFSWGRGHVTNQVWMFMWSHTQKHTHFNLFVLSSRLEQGELPLLVKELLPITSTSISGRQGPVWFANSSTANIRKNKLISVNSLILNSWNNSNQTSYRITNISQRYLSLNVMDTTGGYLTFQRFFKPHLHILTFLNLCCFVPMVLFNCANKWKTSNQMKTGPWCVKTKVLCGRFRSPRCEVVLLTWWTTRVCLCVETTLWLIFQISSS